MGIVIREGFEAGDQLMLSSPSGTTLSTSTKRTGAYALRINNGASGTAPFALPNTYSELLFRIPIDIAALGASGGRLLTWYSATATELGSIRFQKGPPIVLLAYTGTSTLVATGSISLSTATWYMIEVRVKIADSGGVISVKVDGNQDANINYSGDTKPGSETTMASFRLGSGSSDSSYGDIYYDDIGVNDTSGGNNTSWCGDGHIIALTPDSNGDVSQLTGSDGNSTDNYALVDETPSNGDTDYVESGTTNQYDLYNLSASALTGVTILDVYAESRSRDTVAAGGKIALVVKTVSTEYDSSDIQLQTTYTQCIGTHHVVNPNTSAAWTVAQLDALQVGPKVK